jgi:hypothetical protein
MEELPTPAFSLSHLHLMLCGGGSLLASVPFASITHTLPLHTYIYLDQWTRHEEDVATREMAIKNDQSTESRQLLADSFMRCYSLPLVSLTMGLFSRWGSLLVKAVRQMTHFSKYTHQKATMDVAFTISFEPKPVLGIKILNGYIETLFQPNYE